MSYYFGIMPQPIRHNKELKPFSKVLYSEIVSCLNENGQCTKRNAHFKKVLGTSSSTLSSSLTELRQSGFINVEIQLQKGTQKFIKRYITPANFSGEVNQLINNTHADNQIGVINGQLQYDYLGYDTDINRAGTKIAVSSILGSGGPTGQNTGLVQVFDIQSILNINDNTQDLFPSIFPNPSNAKVTINSIKDYKIELFDMNGRLLIEDIGNSLDISKLSNSEYIIKLTALQSKQSLNFKIIKN